MTKERSMRIGFYLLVGALFGVPALLIGFAADAHARHHHSVHSTHSVPADLSTPASNHSVLSSALKSEGHTAPTGTPPDPTKDDKQAGRHSVGAEQRGGEGTTVTLPASTGTKEANSPDMKNLGPVDAQITIVRPYLHGPKAETTRVGTSKIKSKFGKYPRAQHVFVQRKNSPVVRNTIGVPITPRGVTAGQRGAPAGVPAGLKTGAGDRIVNTDPGAGPAGVFHPNAGMVPGGPLGGRGAISGTSFPHRGFVPATLGGQTKMTGALSGSMIRPKY
jgi:hypothetical protein